MKVMKFTLTNAPCSVQVLSRAKRPFPGCVSLPHRQRRKSLFAGLCTLFQLHTAQYSEVTPNFPHKVYQKRGGSDETHYLLPPFAQNSSKVDWEVPYKLFCPFASEGEILEIGLAKNQFVLDESEID